MRRLNNHLTCDRIALLLHSPRHTEAWSRMVVSRKNKLRRGPTSTARDTTPTDSKSNESALPPAPARAPGIVPLTRTQLSLVVALAVGWFIALAALAWWTANPITLNRQQIADSDLVIVGTVENAKTGTVTVDRKWKRDIADQKITIGNLSRVQVKDGEQYLFPLRVTDIPTYVLTPLVDVETPPLVYPSTPAAIEQLEHILGAQK